MPEDQEGKRAVVGGGKRVTLVEGGVKERKNLSRAGYPGKQIFSLCKAAWRKQRGKRL